MTDIVSTGSAASGLNEALKDFQPSLAALVALAAAIFAYRGAIAKVDYDRSVRNSDRVAAKLAVMLRLRSVARRPSNELPILAKGEIELDGILSNMPIEIPEFDEAWQNLVTLPADCMEHLDKARYQLDAAKRLVTGFNINPTPEGASAETREQVERLKPTMKRRLQTVATNFGNACGELETSLDCEIKTLHARIG
jgi:hypothetical protein